MSDANTTSLEQYEVWFLTGSQHLYGEDVLKQVAAQSQEIAAALNESSDVPVKIVWKPVLTDSDAIRRTALEANSRRRRDRRDRVDAHVLPGQDVDRRAWTLLRKPLLHLHTQANVELPWADIDFDFMNLNQAAHGDREFGYIQSRLGIPRKTVVGHVSNPEVAAPGRRLAARLGRLGRRPDPEAGPLRRQHALRRRHRGRQDRGRAALRRLGQHLVRQRARRRRARRRGVRRRRPGRRVRAPLRRGPGAAGRRRPPRVAALQRPASSSGCAASWRPTAPPRSPPPSRTSARCGSCRAWPSSG